MSNWIRVRTPIRRRSNRNLNRRYLRIVGSAAGLAGRRYGSRYTPQSGAYVRTRYAAPRRRRRAPSSPVSPSVAARRRYRASHTRWH